MTETKLGKVKHYFGKVSVAIVLCEEDGLKLGETVHIKGNTSDVTLKVDSMQSNHQELASVLKGQDVAIKVPVKVRMDDTVYKVKE
jgi:putative protease